MKALFLILLLSAIGGFAFFASTDVAVEQVVITKAVPSERFLP